VRIRIIVSSAFNKRNREVFVKNEQSGISIEIYLIHEILFLTYYFIQVFFVVSVYFLRSQPHLLGSVKDYFLNTSNTKSTTHALLHRFFERDLHSWAVESHKFYWFIKDWSSKIKVQCMNKAKETFLRLFPGMP